MKVTVLNKRTLTIIGLVAMLVVAAIINISVKNKKLAEVNENENTQNAQISEEEVETSSQTAMQMLSSYEAERRTTRLQELEYLDEIIASENTDEETRSLASQQRIEVMKNIQQEQVIAEVLAGKGFERVTVVCGSDSVNILVDGSILDDAKVAQILDVVLTETDAEAENVKIIPLD